MATSKKNKTVLVTGASSGIGKAIAQRMLDDGHTVYVAARRTERMQELADHGATAIRMDISKDADIVAAVEQIRSASGGVDVLVNNAGFAVSGAAEDVPIEDARYQFEVNLFGLARLTQLLLPHMRKQTSGTIINISSVGGKIHTPLGSWYHATKYALEGWSDCLRLEVKPFGIHVVVVEPGAIATEFGDVMTGPLMERSGSTAYAPMAKRLAEATQRMLDRGSPPDVIANVVSRATRSRRPATRYAAGKYARMLLFFRRWMSDRMFDRLITSMA